MQASRREDCEVVEGMAVIQDRLEIHNLTLKAQTVVSACCSLTLRLTLKAFKNLLLIQALKPNIGPSSWVDTTG